MGRADLAGPQRREVGAVAGNQHLEEPLGPRQAAQAMLTRIPQFHSDR